MGWGSLKYYRYAHQHSLNSYPIRLDSELCTQNPYCFSVFCCTTARTTSRVTCPLTAKYTVLTSDGSCLLLLFMHRPLIYRICLSPTLYLVTHSTCQRTPKIQYTPASQAVYDILLYHGHFVITSIVHSPPVLLPPAAATTR